MKSILIPTDFSPDAKKNLSSIVSYAQKAGEPCRLLLLNTFILQNTDPDTVIKHNDEMRERSRSGLMSFRDEALRLVTTPGITVDIASHMGSLSNVVHQLLRKEKIDLVALGTPEHIEALSSLLKREKCPLLIVNGA